MADLPCRIFILSSNFAEIEQYLLFCNSLITNVQFHGQPKHMKNPISHHNPIILFVYSHDIQMNHLYFKICPLVVSYMSRQTSVFTSGMNIMYIHIYK